MTWHQGMTTGEPANRAAGAARAGRGVRIAVAAAGVLAAGALLAGCNGDGSGGANAAGPRQVDGSAAPAGQNTSSVPSSGTTVHSAAPRQDQYEDGTPPDEPQPSTTGTRSRSGQAGTGGSASSASQGGRCRTSDLGASVRVRDGAAGHLHYAVVLTNRSGGTCRMYGYPGLAFLNGRGEQVSVDPHRVQDDTPTFRLAPGESAWAALNVVDPDMTGERSVSPDAVKITPPDERASLTVSWPGVDIIESDPEYVPEIYPLHVGTGS